MKESDSVYTVQDEQHKHILEEQLKALLSKYGVPAISVAINNTLEEVDPVGIAVGMATHNEAMTVQTAIQIASLSKTLGSAFSIDFLAKHLIFNN